MCTTIGYGPVRHSTAQSYGPWKEGGVPWAMSSLGNWTHASMRRRARKQDDSWWITSSLAGVSLGQATESPSSAPAPGRCILATGCKEIHKHMDNGRPIWRIPNFSMFCTILQKLERRPSFTLAAGRSIALVCLSLVYLPALPAYLLASCLFSSVHQTRPEAALSCRHIVHECTSKLPMPRRK